MRTIIITRPLAQSAGLVAALRALGFSTVAFPVIQIQPMDNTSRLDNVLSELGKYHWVIFTSINGVEAVWNRLSVLGLQGMPADVKVAAIGPKTAAALQERGAQVDFIPQEYVAEAILPGLGNVSGKRILLPRAEIARKALPEALCKAGGEVDDIPVYRTLPSQPDPLGLDTLRKGTAYVTLTSPSTVRNFVDLTKQAGLTPTDLPGRPVFACIGPITEAAAVEENLAPRIMAQEYTAEGLVSAIMTIENQALKEQTAYGDD